MACKKNIIYACIVNPWIVNRCIVYCELAQPVSEFFKNISFNKESFIKEKVEHQKLKVAQKN